MINSLADFVAFTVLSGGLALAIVFGIGYIFDKIATIKTNRSNI